MSESHIEFERETWLQLWDNWKQDLISSNNDIWPRDAFESLLDYAKGINRYDSYRHDNTDSNSNSNIEESYEI